MNSVFTPLGNKRYSPACWAFSIVLYTSQVRRIASLALCHAMVTPTISIPYLLPCRRGWKTYQLAMHLTRRPKTCSHGFLFLIPLKVVFLCKMDCFVTMASCGLVLIHRCGCELLKHFIPQLWEATPDFRRCTNKSNTYFLGQDLYLLFSVLWLLVQPVNRTNLTDPGIPVSSNPSLFLPWLGKVFP